MKSSKRACCCSRLTAAGRVASFFKVRCMRSWRPFCCGWPGLMRSRSMPRRSHQTDKRLSRRGAGAGEGHAVVGADGAGQAELLEGVLEHGERRVLAGAGEALAGEQVATGEVGDGERVAVAMVAEHELGLEVGAPQLVGLAGPEEGCAPRFSPFPAQIELSTPAGSPDHPAVRGRTGMYRAGANHVQELRLCQAISILMRRSSGR